ncbi:hypothetical protein DFP73DRAFT_552895, partial [Morchella snyderi]
TCMVVVFFSFLFSRVSLGSVLHLTQRARAQATSRCVGGSEIECEWNVGSSKDDVAAGTGNWELDWRRFSASIYFFPLSVFCLYDDAGDKSA